MTTNNNTAIKSLKANIASVIYSIATSVLPNNAKLQYKYGVKLLKLNKLDKALRVFNKVIETDPSYTAAYSRLGDIYKMKSENKNAIKYYQKALEIDPDHIESCSNLANILLPGIPYEQNLQLFHKMLKPESYIEIGIQTGKTLALAGDDTVAIGIDPEPKIIYNLTSKTKVYPVRSDAFFESYNVKNEMGTEEVDFAFIDGLHTFEQVLKDFINVERYSRKDTVICIHDCLPLNEYTATPDKITSFWTGDVWKIMPCLKKYRPDLKIFTIPTAPSGLGVVTNLDPQSTILADNLDAIFAEYRDTKYKYNDNTRNKAFNVIANNWSDIEKEIAKSNTKISA